MDHYDRDLLKQNSVEDEVEPSEAAVGRPSNATPDQTRQNGMRSDLAKTLSHADTSGLVELRKRKGNLEGM